MKRRGCSRNGERAAKIGARWRQLHREGMLLMGRILGHGPLVGALHRRRRERRRGRWHRRRRRGEILIQSPGSVIAIVSSSNARHITWAVDPAKEDDSKPVSVGCLYCKPTDVVDSAAEGKRANPGSGDVGGARQGGARLRELHRHAMAHASHGEASMVGALEGRKGKHPAHGGR